MLLRSMTLGLLVGTLYATLSIGHDVHIHSMIAAEQRSACAPVVPPIATPGPRIIDITAAAAADQKLLRAAVGLQPGEEIVAVNDLYVHTDDARSVLPAFGLLGAAPGSYLDLTVRRASREDRVLVLVH